MNKRFKRIFSILCGVLALGISVNAANIGVCTHMTAKHTGETPERITELAKEIGTEWIRDELRWGWGMQTVQNGEMQMPATDWTGLIEDSGINSLLILGYGNSIYNREGIEDEGEEYIPTVEHTAYFDAWKEYVKFVAQNCKDKVDAYEVWNEPNHAPFNYQLSKNRYSYTASDYAELLIATKEVLDIYDPDAKVIGGSFFLGGTVTSGWAEELFRTLNARGGADKYMDGFSFHIYSYSSKNKEKDLRDSLDDLERIMDTYGFTGEAWLTETGYYTGTDTDSVSEEEYASLVIRNKIIWDDYLKDNNRKGNYFWYVMKSTGRDETKGGDNFGLTTYGYNPKQGFYSAKAYNTILKDMEMTSLTASYDGNDYVALYQKSDSEITDKVYVAYKKGNYSEEIQLPVSGNAAYIYDYMGNLVEIADVSGGTIPLRFTNTSPVFVHCVDYSTEICDVKYDADKNICEVTGNAKYLDNITLELIENDVVVQTEDVSVNSDGSYKKVFQPERDGEYIIRVGKNEVESLGGKVWAEKEVALYKTSLEETIALTYLTEKESDGLCVSITGSVSSSLANEVLNVLMVPHGSVNFSEAVYAGEVLTNENGEFEISFKIPEKTPHINQYTLYIRGEKTKLLGEEIDDIPDGVEIVAYDFDLTLNDGVYTASAYVKNMTQNKKKPAIFIAQYDENGIMIQAVWQEIEADGTKKPITVSVPKNESAKKCRAFIWEGKDIIKPVAPPIDENID